MAAPRSSPKRANRRLAHSQAAGQLLGAGLALAQDGDELPQALMLRLLITEHGGIAPVGLLWPYSSKAESQIRRLWVCLLCFFNASLRRKPSCACERRRRVQGLRIRSLSYAQASGLDPALASLVRSPTIKDARRHTTQDREVLRARKSAAQDGSQSSSLARVRSDPHAARAHTTHRPRFGQASTSAAHDCLRAQNPYSPSRRWLRRAFRFCTCAASALPPPPIPTAPRHSSPGFRPCCVSPTIPPAND
ncbi:MAG: hypothetical protein KatS3mg052_2027 [Candidatus Roseilinea sp.]|nr:MAG: hypothetical protein KatS3mg052_2027 [Candidatus Roseilinea sp.]